MEPSFVVPPERTDDKHLMDIANTHPNLTTHAIRVINYCRLYLHVTTVSEILTADGTHILPLMLQCHRPPWFDPTMNMIIQKRPSEYQIRTKWRPFCQYILHQRLFPGPWLGTNPLRLRRESYATNGTQCNIYSWYQGCYWQCTAPKRVGKGIAITLQEATEWTPPSTEFVAPFQTSARIHKTIYAPMSSPLARTTAQPAYSPLTRIPSRFSCLSTDPEFDKYVSGLPNYLWPFLSNVEWFPNPVAVTQQLLSVSREEPLLLVSDGSWIEGVRMSFGGVLGTTAGKVLARYHGNATGQPSSHRAEARCTTADTSGALHTSVISEHLGPCVLR